MNRTPLRTLVVAVVIGASLSGGCVRRTMIITTDPPQALVYLNDEEIGRSEVSTDFLWYGDYDVIVRKEGYKTLKTHWKIDPPWYQVIPFDFFAEVLWPGHLHDTHTRQFKLDPEVQPTSEELIARALAARERAFDPRR
ncbi:MAG: PEGA domain-containing protein [Planctomycetes bacterium]|nr:PEGA domain-containing protein [Planctomycetota bacterium]